MLSSSSSTFFIPPFLSSSSSSSPPLSPFPAPSRVSRISPSHSATTTASYTCTAEDLRQRFQPTASLYEILEIPAGSTSQEIKSAYRRLARIYHPDVAGNSRSSNSSAADDFMKIHAAYCTLSDPEKRAVYDRRRMLLSRRRPLTVGVSGCGSYGGRNWETDQCW
ncbi:PREDICTED: chaperone protein dnaJ 11, chloroplastic-like [Camelina sativa]|uniref:Chaperone protein dnaJ 11, chloroplastic-like n=1 Tax=Camelina sativa TaxID=90675 RepID=A0ABM0SMB9_CAMSA|nr:PREDICTED: chaperone protein dnaJ 11, chloroplastic-like [Camelina sativa]